MSINKVITAFALLVLPSTGWATAYYVRSAAAGAANGTSWTDAYTTLATAMSGKAAGDVFYLADDHAETTTGSLTLTAVGTAVSPIRVVCTNTHVTVPPTAKGTTCAISTTGASANIIYTGFASVYGVTFTAGASTNLAGMFFGNSSTSTGWKLDSCALVLGNTSTAAAINLGLVSGTIKDTSLDFINTTLQFANASQTVVINSARVSWRDTASAIAGATIPTTLLTSVSGDFGRVEISGVDLSALASGKNLVNVGIAGTAAIDVLIRNSLINSAVTVMTGTITGPGGGQVFLENTDSTSGNTNYRMEVYRHQGSIVSGTSNPRTGGASDGTTLIDWKMKTLTSGPSIELPLASSPIIQWNESTGSSMTATVQILHDNVTNLTNADAWLRCEYLGSSASPRSSYVSSRVADIFATAADLAAGVGTGSWTTTGLSNANSQKLVVTFTPQKKGPVSCQVMLAKTNYTVYVDPLVTLQ